MFNKFFKNILSKPLFPILFLFLLNLWFCFPLFKIEYPIHLGSIEPIYYFLIRFTSQNLFNINLWNPYWYLGFPHRFINSPLFIYLTAFIKLIFSNFSIPFIYRVSTSLFLLLSPISFYFLALKIAKKRNIALLATIIYSFFPSASYLLPSLGKEVLKFNLPPSRFLIYFYFGNGPRIIALTLLPLFFLFYLNCLENWQFKNIVKTSILAAFILLLDFTTSFSLLLLTAIFLVSLSSLNKKEAEYFRRTVLLLLVTFGLVSFWYNLPYLKNLFASPSLGGNSFGKIVKQLFQIFLIGIPTYLAVLTSKIKKGEKDLFKIISLFWTGLFGFLIFLYYLENREFVSEFIRFSPEFDMGVALTLSWILPQIIKKEKSSFSFYAKRIVVFLISLFLFFPFFIQRGKFLAPHSDIKSTHCFKLANWIDKNAPDQRIYATGALSFWLNGFFNLYQVRGGMDSASVHPWWHHGSYQIREGEDGELAVLWLKALRVGYIVVNFPESEEFYKDYKHPEKLADYLEMVFDDQKGNKIYELPVFTSNLALAVDKEKITSLKQLERGSDKKHLEVYVKAVEAYPDEKINFSWENTDEALIKVNLKKNQAVSLGVAFDPNWRATFNGRRLKTSSDILGNLIIFPERGELMDIKLQYVTPLSVYLGYLISVVTVVFLISFLFFPKSLQRRLLDLFKSEEEEQ